MQPFLETVKPKAAKLANAKWAARPAALRLAGGRREQERTAPVRSESKRLACGTAHIAYSGHSSRCPRRENTKTHGNMNFLLLVSVLGFCQDKMLGRGNTKHDTKTYPKVAALLLFAMCLLCVSWKAAQDFDLISWIICARENARAADLGAILQCV